MNDSSTDIRRIVYTENSYFSNKCDKDLNVRHRVFCVAIDNDRTFLTVYKNNKLRASKNL